jgi:hypothetical protein
MSSGPREVEFGTSVVPPAIPRAGRIAPACAGGACPGHGVAIGSWLHRQLTTWPARRSEQRELMTILGLTPDTTPLTAARRTRRTFEQTVQLLELILHR